MPLQDSVGRNGRNLPQDVLVVQQLLAANTTYLIPAAPVTPTGTCDGQTIYLIEVFQQRALNLTPPTGRVEQNSPTWFALNGTSGGSTVSPVVDESLRLLRSEVINFSTRFITDSAVRANYVAQCEQFSQELINRVMKSEIMPEAAANEANILRNGLLDAARLQSSDIGRAAAEAEKATGLSIQALKEKYAQRMFQREFSQLAAEEQDSVFIEIVRAAGRPNPRFNALARGLGKGGRALLVVAIAFSVYNIASADRPGREAVKQGVGLGAGLAGSMAGGALAGLACGPGAPICVGVGVFVGGLAFALGADLTFDWLWE
jgi:hypothetical protein